MEKIKVLQITQSVGGVETYLRQMVHNINRDRFEIIIVSCEPTLKQFCEEASVKYYEVKMSRGFNPFRDFSSVLSLRKIIKKEKPALVHLHSSKAGFVGRIAAKTTSCKSLFTPHGGSYLQFTGAKRLTFFMLELFAKRFTHKLLCISWTEAERFSHEVGINSENILVIPNSIKIPETPVVVPDKLGQLAGAVKIGTIGRITYQKNPLLLADIVYDVTRKFPDVHFYFLGAGFHDHLRTQLDEKIKKYGIENNLHLIEKGDGTIALNFLRQLDMFILPSRYEGLSYALLEAMYESVPCIVSKVDGNNDVINNNENGFSCITREQYNAVITALIADKEKAKSIGATGKQYVIDKHNISTNIKLLEDIYAGL